MKPLNNFTAQTWQLFDCVENSTDPELFQFCTDLSRVIDFSFFDRFFITVKLGFIAQLVLIAF